MKELKGEYAYPELFTDKTEFLFSLFWPKIQCTLREYWIVTEIKWFIKRWEREEYIYGKTQ